MAFRPLVFRTFLFITLGLFIFLSIAVNYYISGNDIPNWMLLLIIISLIVVLIIDWTYTLISYSSALYVFYPDSVRLFRSTINYSTITHVEIKRGLFDKLMKTGNIVLYSSEKKYIIRYIYDFEKIKNYFDSKINH